MKIDFTQMVTAEAKFELAREAKLSQINSEFDERYNALTAGYPNGEKMTWDIQRVEALAWQADNNAPTPYLDDLADGRGIDRVDMRQRTLNQTLLFIQASKPLIYTRQRLSDLAYKAKTPADLDAIVWPTQQEDPPEPPET